MQNRQQKMNDPVHKIDPTLLTENDSEILTNYWDSKDKNSSDFYYVSKNTPHLYQAEDGSFSVRYHIARVVSTLEHIQNTKEKYRTLGKKIGSGSFGKVYSVIASSKRIGQGKLENKKDFRSDKWVAKVEDLNDAERESTLLQQIPEFKATKPTPFANGQFIFFMRRAPGINLRKWLKHFKKNYMMTPLRAALVWQAIIIAYIKQIFDNQLIHGDITLSNIMIYTKNPRQPIVTFVDLGLGQCITHPFPDDQTAQKYAAPEVLANGKKSTASDIFALGCLMEHYFPQLDQIRPLVKSMQDNDPEKRPDLGTITKTLAELINPEPAPATAEEKAFAEYLFDEIQKLDHQTAWFDSGKVGNLHLQTRTAKMLAHYFDFRDGLISGKELHENCYNIAKESMQLWFWSTGSPVSAARPFYNAIIKTYEENASERSSEQFNVSQSLA